MANRDSQDFEAIDLNFEDIEDVFSTGPSSLRELEKEGSIEKKQEEGPFLKQFDMNNIEQELSEMNEIYDLIKKDSDKEEVSEEVK